MVGKKRCMGKRVRKWMAATVSQSEKRYIEKLACVRLSTKVRHIIRVQWVYNVSESANSCLAALLDIGARIFDISSSLMN